MFCMLRVLVRSMKLKELKLLLEQLGLWIFLGFLGNPVGFECDFDYTLYYDYVRENYEMDEIVFKYRNFLKFNAVKSKAGMIKYDNPFEFVHTMEKQMALYYESLYKAKNEYPDAVFYIPNDGLGACSIVCMMLELPYYSTENYGIGSMAVSLGIITSSRLGIEIAYDIIVLCNLSSYVNVSSYVGDSKYIVIDENRLYEGVVVPDIKKSTHGQVSSNILADDFITVTRQICTSYPMIKDKRNIPLSSKAEMYLLEKGLEVYTDGDIDTVTKAVSGGDHYIDVVDSTYATYKRDKYKVCLCEVEKQLTPLRKGYIMYCPKCEVHYHISESFTKFPYDYLNIVNRNKPRFFDRGKMGNVKEYGNCRFVVADENKIATDNEFFLHRVHLYENPRELKYYEMIDGFFVGKCANPHSIRYLYDNGVRRSLIFMRTLDKNRERYYVFRDVMQVQEISTVID